MSFREKLFEQQAMFDAPFEQVTEAARAMANSASSAWQLTDTANGFVLRGNSAGHDATVRFDIDSIAGGTRIKATMRVERASPLGFMLTDVGGYYDGHLRKWIDGVEWHLKHQYADGGPATGSSLPAPPPSPCTPNKAGMCFFGCLFLVFAGSLGTILIASVIGLATGNLHLYDRYGNEVVFHGPWARVASGLTLAGAAWLVWRARKARQEKRKLTLLTEQRIR